MQLALRAPRTFIVLSKLVKHFSLRAAVDAWKSVFGSHYSTTIPHSSTFEIYPKTQKIHKKKNIWSWGVDGKKICFRCGESGRWWLTALYCSVDVWHRPLQFAWLLRSFFGIKKWIISSLNIENTDSKLFKGSIPGFEMPDFVSEASFTSKLFHLLLYFS